MDPKKALECPCVADLVKGACGKEFSKAFGCFIKSEQPAKVRCGYLMTDALCKGSDCVEPFEKMQKCMIDNAKEFSSTEAGHRLPTGRNERNEEDSESEDDDEEIPAVPENKIRLPPWYFSRRLSENLSRGSK